MLKRFWFAVGLAFLGLLVFFPFQAQAVTYQWTDEQGNIHFTDDLTNVPPSFREYVETVPLPEYEHPPSPAPAATTPPAYPLPEKEDEPFSLEPGRSPLLGPAAKCREELYKEKKRLKKQLASDQARLEELKKLIHRTARSRLKNRYQRERVQVKERILQAQKVMDEGWPQRERECEGKKGF